MEGAESVKRMAGPRKVREERYSSPKTHLQEQEKAFMLIQAKSFVIK